MGWSNFRQDAHLTWKQWTNNEFIVYETPKPWPLAPMTYAEYAGFFLKQRRVPRRWCVSTIRRQVCEPGLTSLLGNPNPSPTGKVETHCFQISPQLDHKVTSKPD